MVKFNKHLALDLSTKRGSMREAAIVSINSFPSISIH